MNILRVHAAGRRNIKPRNRLAVMLRDARTCFYCGRSFKRMTIDHVLPISRGGGSSQQNLVCSCEECNRRKGDKTLDEFRPTLLLRWLQL